jgi:Family of unknown function (DUF6527)
MRVSRLKHRFVDTVPETIEAGVLYISIEFRTTIHLCCCGCGNTVVLPLRRAAWRLTYDGHAITISPSVGNWSFPCKSHYIIREDRVIWAGDWSPERIEAGRRATLTERLENAEPSRAAVYLEEEPLSRGLLKRLSRRG